MAGAAITDPTAVQNARAAARWAAERAGVETRQLETIGEMRAAVRMLQEPWGMPHPPFQVELVRAFREAGNYAAAAFRGEDIVGASMAFLGWSGEELVLHSHITGVLPGTQGRSVGFALKQFQRAWALACGVSTVVWTFDPLVRRNAYFNLTKLGAVGATYFVNFYGRMGDDLNADEESDRCLARWELMRAEAVEAAGGRPYEPDAEELRGRAAMVLSEDADGAPRASSERADVLLAQIPADAIELRRTRPDLARDWRIALRDTFGAALAQGWVATGISRDGWYVLARKEGP